MAFFYSSFLHHSVSVFVLWPMRNESLAGRIEPGPLGGDAMEKSTALTLFVFVSLSMGYIWTQLALCVKLGTACLYPGKGSASF